VPVNTVPSEMTMSPLLELLLPPDEEQAVVAPSSRPAAPRTAIERCSAVDVRNTNLHVVI
jgi:hypothetical protein